MSTRNFGKKSLIGLSLLTAVLSTSGCGNWISAKHIEKATELCSANGGVKHLSIFANDTVVCNNGAEFEREEWMGG